MEKGKLIELLGSFNARDWKRFRNFVASPYFNRQPEPVQLCDWLWARAPAFAGLEREQVWDAVFPGQPCDERRLHYLLSQLLELAERFVGYETLHHDDAAVSMATIEGLSSRGLDKHYRFNAEAFSRALSASPLRDARHFFLCYRLGDLERAHFDRQGQRRLHESAQAAADCLDHFYLTEKLKYTCAMLNSQAATTAPFHLHWFDELRRALDGRPLPPEAPGIEVYFRILRLLTRESADEDFRHLKFLLPQCAARFEKGEMATLYEYALNYCIRQIRKVREEYVAETLLLYEQGVESGLLLGQTGKLSPWHFKNIIKLALRLRRFDWAEQFIRDKNALLDDDFKADALHYNLAELFFYTHRYDEALRHLNRVEFTDVYYNLGAKVMLAKIYYETDALDPLESLLHAFRIYLRRNKILSEDVRRAYLNFITLLRRLLRATPDGLAGLRRQVEKTESLTEKNWLLEQMAR